MARQREGIERARNRRSRSIGVSLLSALHYHGPMGIEAACSFVGTSAKGVRRSFQSLEQRGLAAVAKVGDVVDGMILTEAGREFVLRSDLEPSSLNAPKERRGTPVFRDLDPRIVTLISWPKLEGCPYRPCTWHRMGWVCGYEFAHLKIEADISLETESFKHGYRVGCLARVSAASPIVVRNRTLAVA